MAYQSRKKYKSRREKNQAARRTAGLVVLFVSLGILLYLLKHRVAIWDWLRWQFYN